MATKIWIECLKCGCDFEGDNSQTEQVCPECGMIQEFEEIGQEENR